jgi:predicted ester cyclase
MTPETVMRTWFEEVWNNGDESAIDRLMAPACVAHGLGEGPPIVGPEGFKPFFRNFRSAFPDIRVEVLRTVTEGDLICLHCHVTATHTGGGLGVAPTAKPVEFSGMAIVRVENDQLQEAWNSFDFMSLFQQVNLLPKLSNAQTR